MPQPNKAALDFLLTRRSRPARTLGLPAPDRAALEPILTAALRTPDHGKLEPWRLIVLEPAALHRLARLITERGLALRYDDIQIEKSRSAFAESPLAVAVIESPVKADKVPEIEQTYSAGAVCLACLNAALATGWGANWLTGWPAHDRDFGRLGLGLDDHERVAGFIHIGTETSVPPERPRPDPKTRIEWVST
ncbi:Nitroreductase [Salinihabitans flavidus]|uniref:Putative NAD(P)H nitroreductase n=1 Tax=Salinihabitans flavidus TaxID=569882 RepID=A0A1H8Q4D6_9RHOB|nr:nitroreductase [Salinihabitans flavidus]SEO49080.1 Nitroreductase [Salinihabitans flavidus]